MSLWAKLQHRPQRPPYKFSQNNETKSKILKLLLRDLLFISMTQHVYAIKVLQLGLRPIRDIFFWV